jgi:hypothetical protein
MAAAIAVLKKINQRKIDAEEANDANALLDLTTRLPSQELWIEEQFLGILVLGWVKLKFLLCTGISACSIPVQKQSMATAENYCDERFLAWCLCLVNSNT